MHTSFLAVRVSAQEIKRRWVMPRSSLTVPAVAWKWGWTLAGIYIYTLNVRRHLWNAPPNIVMATHIFSGLTFIHMHTFWSEHITFSWHLPWHLRAIYWQPNFILRTCFIAYELLVPRSTHKDSDFIHSPNLLPQLPPFRAAYNANSKHESGKSKLHASCKY